MYGTHSALTALLRGLVAALLLSSPVDLSLIVQHPNVGAIVIAGYPGQSGGLAVAEIVFGAINPSGRLSQTWWVVRSAKIAVWFYAVAVVMRYWVRLSL